MFSHAALLLPSKIFVRVLHHHSWQAHESNYQQHVVMTALSCPEQAADVHWPLAMHGRHMVLLYHNASRVFWCAAVLRVVAVLAQAQ